MSLLGLLVALGLGPLAWPAGGATRRRQGLRRGICPPWARSKRHSSHVSSPGKWQCVHVNLVCSFPKICRRNFTPPWDTYRPSQLVPRRADVWIPWAQGPPLLSPQIVTIQSSFRSLGPNRSCFLQLLPQWYLGACGLNPACGRFL